MKIQCNPHSKSKSFHIPATQNYVTLVPKNATSHPCLAQRDDGGAWVCPFVMGNMGKCWSTLISHQIWHAWDHLFHRKFMSGVKCLRTSDLWRVTWFTDDLLIQPKFTTCPTRHENKIVFFLTAPLDLSPTLTCFANQCTHPPEGAPYLPSRKWQRGNDMVLGDGETHDDQCISHPHKHPKNLVVYWICTRVSSKRVSW